MERKVYDALVSKFIVTSFIPYFVIFLFYFVFGGTRSAVVSVFGIAVMLPVVYGTPVIWVLAFIKKFRDLSADKGGICVLFVSMAICLIKPIFDVLALIVYIFNEDVRRGWSVNGLEDYILYCFIGFWIVLTVAIFGSFLSGRKFGKLSR